MSTGSFSIQGNIVDVLRQRIYPGEVVVKGETIYSIRQAKTKETQFILPGFVDAHVHIESSMLVPSEFARVAVTHGTVGSVSDPHEIANVCGLPGVQFMLENTARSPFQVAFGAPSCVPATIFETAGAELTAIEVRSLLENPRITYLSEVMNYPGVIADEKSIMEKIHTAKILGKYIDGHAPGLRGQDLKKYVAAGISTDHECFSKEEALEKIKLGMKILIREGSAAKNFDVLIPLLAQYPEMVMFCSDDKHPNNLVTGHINQLVRRAIKLGIEPMKVLRAACLNPVKHYGLRLGLLGKGDSADFIVVDDLTSLNILSTYLRGLEVSTLGKPLLQTQSVVPINKFMARPVAVEQIRYPANGKSCRAIGAIDGQIITSDEQGTPSIVAGNFESNPATDTLKIVVVNRYQDSNPAVSFVKNFGLKRGAIASSVAHDSHNIIAVGVSDDDIIKAINVVIESKGGLALIDGNFGGSLPLPVAGLMSTLDAYDVARRYEFLESRAKDLGSSLASPFMTLSFLALLVIPKLKLSDKGLFDVDKFALV